MNGILYNIEKSINRLFASSSISSSLSCYTGISNEEKTAPCVITYTEGCKEDFIGGGVWHVSTKVIVKSMAIDTTIQTADSSSDYVFATICDKNSINTINSYSSSLTIYDILIDNIDRSLSEDAWIDTISLDVIAVNNNS